MIDPGEDPLTGGLRELREETGFTGEDSRIIGSVSPNPAIHTNRCHTVLVERATQSHPPEPDEKEELGIRRVPLEEIPRLIQEGLIHHALVVAAFHHHALLG
jgi:8-oxo-dGTP pyrophosphatase MutT (NUDIX family)